MVSTENSSFCKNSFGKTIFTPKTASAGERPVSSLGCALSPTLLIYLLLFSCAVFNPIALKFLCMSHPSLQLIFCSKLAALCQIVHSFALQWLPIFILLGTSAQQTFGICQPFPNLPTCLVFRPSGFFTFSFISASTQRSRNRFPTRQGGSLVLYLILIIVRKAIKNEEKKIEVYSFLKYFI